MKSLDANPGDRRHFPGPHARPAKPALGGRRARPHTCRAGEGPVLGRGGVRRGGAAPRSLAEYQALPLPGGV